MADQACSHCGKPTSIRFLYDLNGRIFCRDCIQQAANEARERGQSASYIPLIQKSICASCHGYIGESAAAVEVGNLRVCQACAEKVRDWDYPLWLKAALGALLVLLGVALLHGRKYFQVGRELYRGERLVEEKRYAEALPHLKATLKVAPESDKAALLAAKAALLIGDVDSAQSALQGHNGGKFEDGNDAQFLEVKDIWNRANKALELADKAAKLANEEGKDEEAAKLMHEAATYYPELPGLSFAADNLDEEAALARNDLETFLAVAQKRWREHPSPSSAAPLASALACKYATTRDAKYRQQSEEMIEKARQLSQGDAEAVKNFEEYAPLLRQALDNKALITLLEEVPEFSNSKADKK